MKEPHPVRDHAPLSCRSGRAARTRVAGVRRARTGRREHRSRLPLKAAMGIVSPSGSTSARMPNERGGRSIDREYGFRVRASRLTGLDGALGEHLVLGDEACHRHRSAPAEIGPVRALEPSLSISIFLPGRRVQRRRDVVALRWSGRGCAQAPPGVLPCSQRHAVIQGMSSPCASMYCLCSINSVADPLSEVRGSRPGAPAIDRPTSAAR